MRFEKLEKDMRWWTGTLREVVLAVAAHQQWRKYFAAALYAISPAYRDAVTPPIIAARAAQIADAMMVEDARRERSS